MTRRGEHSFGQCSLFCRAFDEGDIAVLLGDGSGAFRPPVISVPAVDATANSVDVADLDLDGTLDLAWADFGPHVYFMRGDGTGAFTPCARVSSSYSREVVLVDLDADGVLDAVVANDVRDVILVFLGSLIAPSPASFIRADSNGDGGLDIADAIFSLGSLFVSGSPPPLSRDSADSNDDGMFDISDPIHTLTVLFTPGTPPHHPPHPDCGLDPTADPLDCEEFDCP